MKKNLKFLYILSSVLFILSCAATPPTKFYTLAGTADSVKPIDSRKILIGIDVVFVAGYIERPQIITYRDNTQVEMSEFNRWAEALTYSVQRVVAENVSNYFKNGMAKPATTGRSGYTYIVQIELNKLDGRFGDMAQLDAWWTITGQDRQMLAREHTYLKTPVGDSYNDLVEKQSWLIGELSSKIAHRISKLK